MLRKFPENDGSANSMIHYPEMKDFAKQLKSAIDDSHIAGTEISFNRTLGAFFFLVECGDNNL